jgi:hypothetical protein
MPCSSAVKMLEPDLSYHDFQDLGKGLKLRKKSSGGGRVLLWSPL